MNLSTTFASLRKAVAGLSLVTLVAGMVATGVASAATSSTFSDVPADAWFAQYVNGLADAGVIDTTANNYRPSDLVNRAEMAKFAFQVSGLPLETATTAPFKDVPMGQWYTNYIYTLSKNGVVGGDKLNGVATGFFRPSDALNRAEATKMLVNAAQMAEDLSGAPHFPDVKSADWFYNFVETAFNNGVVAGYPDGSFGPAKNINRAEAAKMVYLSMNPVSTGFTLDSAAAASKTQVELIYSMNVNKASAETLANYSIEDSTGNPLSVSAVAKTADDTVMLTTGTQTQGKVYYVTAKNVTSDAGDTLANTDAVSFLGYGADVSGGPLSVKLSSETPVSGSVPSGATGVVFTCWDFKAGSDAAMLKTVRAHRVGAGATTAFNNVYLYRGDMRLTTGRSINSQTSTVEFSNINQSIAAGENAKLCLVGDLASGLASAGSVQAFELESADDIMSNSSDLTGSFPLRGADQLITSAVVSTAEISKNGSLSEVSVGDENARIAQFKISNQGSSEDQELRRIALYVNGRVSGSDLTNLKLYVEGTATPLATASSVGDKDLITFTLATPFKINRSQSKIFYVTGNVVNARNNDDIKIYLDEATDLNVVGNTYGYGVQVSNLYTSATPSTVSVKAAKFTVSSNALPAGDIAVNQKQALCLDLTLKNGVGSAVDLKDWKIKLDGTLTDLASAAKYTNVKLALLNEDGSIGGSLFDSAELTNPLTASRLTDTLTVRGTYTLGAGESVRAGVVVDVDPTATGTLTCTLIAPNAAGNVKVGNDDIGTDITPQSNITGSQQTIVSAALTLSRTSQPTQGTNYAKGTPAANAILLGVQAKAGSALDTTIKSLTLQGINTGVACTFPCIPAADTSNIRDHIDSIGLYDQAGTLISDIKSFSTGTTATATFNNLNIAIPKNGTVNFYVKGTVSTSASPIQATFQILGDALVIDQNGETVSSPLATVAQVINLGSTTTVTNNTVASNDPLVYSENQEAKTFEFRLRASNGNASLKDLTVDLATTTGAILPVQAVALKTAPTQGACSTSLKDFESVVGSGATGSVSFTNANLALVDSQDTYVCIVLRASSVTNGTPTSLSDIQVTGVSITKLLDQSGTPVAGLPIAVSVLGDPPDYFFKSVPTFGPVANDSVLSTTTDILKFTAGSAGIGSVSKLNQLGVTFAGVTPNACDLYRSTNATSLGTKLTTAPVSTVGNTVTFDSASMVGGLATDWFNGNVYTVECDYTLVPGATESSTAQLAPFTGADSAAIVWDDNNSAPTGDTTDLTGFGLVDSVLFHNVTQGNKASHS